MNDLWLYQYIWGIFMQNWIGANCEPKNFSTSILPVILNHPAPTKFSTVLQLSNSDLSKWTKFIKFSHCVRTSTSTGAISIPNYVRQIRSFLNFWNGFGSVFSSSTICCQKWVVERETPFVQVFLPLARFYVCSFRVTHFSKIWKKFNKCGVALFASMAKINIFVKKKFR